MYFQIAQGGGLDGQCNDLFAGDFLCQAVQERIFRATADDVKIIILKASIPCLLLFSPKYSTNFTQIRLWRSIHMQQTIDFLLDIGKLCITITLEFCCHNSIHQFLQAPQEFFFILRTCAIAPSITTLITHIRNSAKFCKQDWLSLITMTIGKQCLSLRIHAIITMIILIRKLGCILNDIIVDRNDITFIQVFKSIIC